MTVGRRREEANDAKAEVVKAGLYRECGARGAKGQADGVGAGETDWCTSDHDPSMEVGAIGRWAEALRA